MLLFHASERQISKPHAKFGIIFKNVVLPLLRHYWTIYKWILLTLRVVLNWNAQPHSFRKNAFLAIFFKGWILSFLSYFHSYLTISQYSIIKDQAINNLTSISSVTITLLWFAKVLCSDTKEDWYYNLTDRVKKKISRK